MNRTANHQKGKRKQAARALSESDSLKPIILNSLKGLAIGMASAIVLLLILCAVAMSTKDPAALGAPLSYFALIASAFIAGTASSKINKNNGMLCGAITGGMYMIFLFTVSLFLRFGETERLGFLYSLGLKAAVLLSSVVGGRIAQKKFTKRPKRKR